MNRNKNFVKLMQKMAEAFKLVVKHQIIAKPNGISHSRSVTVVLLPAEAAGWKLSNVNLSRSLVALR